MKKIVAIMALALGGFVPGNAAAQPSMESRSVNQNACERTDQVWTSAPGSARAGIPHDQGHGDGCHHAIGTQDPQP